MHGFLPYMYNDSQVYRASHIVMDCIMVLMDRRCWLWTGHLTSHRFLVMCVSLFSHKSKKDGLFSLLIVPHSTYSLYLILSSLLPSSSLVLGSFYHPVSCFWLLWCVSSHLLFLYLYLSVVSASCQDCQQEVRLAPPHFAGGQAHATSLIHWRSGVSCLCVCIMSHNIDGLEGSCCGKGLSRCAIFLIYFCLFPPLPIPPFLSQMPVHYGCDLGCSMPCLFIMGPHPTFFTLLNATFLSRVDNHWWVCCISRWGDLLCWPRALPHLHIPGQIKLAATSIYPFPTVAPNSSTSPIPSFDPSHALPANY